MPLTAEAEKIVGRPAGIGLLELWKKIGNETTFSYETFWSIVTNENWYYYPYSFSINFPAQVICLFVVTGCLCVLQTMLKIGQRYDMGQEIQFRSSFLEPHYLRILFKDWTQ